jgi:hypothetical protein
MRTHGTIFRAYMNQRSARHFSRCLVENKLIRADVFYDCFGHVRKSNLAHTLNLFTTRSPHGLSSLTTARSVQFNAATCLTSDHCNSIHYAFHSDQLRRQDNRQREIPEAFQ